MYSARDLHRPIYRMEICILYFSMFKDERKDSSTILSIFYRMFDDNTLDDYDQMKTLGTNNLGTFCCVNDTLLFHRSIAGNL